ncbi:putative IQ motif, EF-hand binding protein [Rosa chinensis]|uniref:Putative IQ motif, EF-hand binding protein n=1 Tax=Rosa chinensis TaxID=74649 RepID=A0A2P6Q4H0_ROSCH|nr:protein IQ-DOMAIN 1 [Rosa chinensis]XP_024160918.1 protein IQ-DOMAIN 1 [Rosa chinensis]PRQ29083.1 putative IQ motif, EF-hand binding protein [Rosa chinensis]
MGSGNWFKALTSLRKAKFGSSKRVKGSTINLKNLSGKESNFANGTTNKKLGSLDMPVEDIAAIRIQTAFRAHVARKALRRLKGIVRLQMLTQAYPVIKQATTTLSYLHLWSRIQTDIRTRRLCMVTEGRIKQKKLENQNKLEAKLHDIEVEWSGGSETMDDILSRIYQREEAAVKRERAMAYAFSHQWRANCSQSQSLGSYELGKANWGWSWKERWIAARPWESRVQSPSPKKVQAKQASKVGKNINSPTPKTSVSVKLPSPNGKGTPRARKLSYTANEEKPVPHAEGIKAEEANNQK